MIFFSFLFPLAVSRSAPGTGGGGVAEGRHLCRETLINREEGQTRPRQGYGLENSLCVQRELIYTFVRPAQVVYIPTGRFLQQGQSSGRFSFEPRKNSGKLNIPQFKQ